MHCLIQTPAGPLTDSMILYKPGGIYGVSPNPLWEEQLLKEESDLERLAFLLPTPTRAMFEPRVRMAEVVGERGLVHISIETALTHQAGWAMELVDLMVACYERPAFARSLLGLYHQHTMAMERCALEAGAEAIFSTDYFSSLSAGWSPKLYREFLLPSYARRPTWRTSSAPSFTTMTTARSWPCYPCWRTPALMSSPPFRLSPWAT